MKHQTVKQLFVAVLVAAVAFGLSLEAAATEPAPQQGITKTTIERLQPYLKNAKPEIRATAAAVLGEICCKGAVEPLTEMMKNDAEPGVRIVAANALARLKDCSVVPDIRKQAERESNETARHVLTVIADHLEQESTLVAVEK